MIDVDFARQLKLRIIVAHDFEESAILESLLGRVFEKGQATIITRTNPETKRLIQKEYYFWATDEEYATINGLWSSIADDHIDYDYQKLIELMK